MPDPNVLTPAQRDLLALFRHNVPEEDWIAVRRLIARYFAEKATEAADSAWDKHGWTEEDMIRMLKEDS